MDFREQIKSLLKEADLYQQQGLLNEAKERFRKATELIKQNAHIPNSQQLIAKIVQKVVGLNQAIDRINTATSKPQVSNRKQDLIKKLFSSGREANHDDADLEGAIALAKFGQFERALQEFERLLDSEPLRVAAAKNILRCQLELGAMDAAVEGFRSWTQDQRFSAAQLQQVRFFLESRLTKSGRSLDVAPADEPRERPQVVTGVESGARQAQGSQAPAPVVPSQDVEAERPVGPSLGGEEEFLDINSVGIHFDRGPQKGQMVEFDVSFQTGNAINLIIPSKDRSVIDHLEAGSRLDDIQFFSPIAILNGSGIVTAKTRIKSGPKEGDFSLDIAIVRS
jgi:tetratricopeptide (TPR) repeat protein